MSDNKKRDESLYQSLRDLYIRLSESISSKFNRRLPFNELLVDRWDKAKSLGFGSGSSIHDSSHVYGDVSVGENTWIGPFTILDGSGGLIIGDNCSISAGVQLYSHDSVVWAISHGKKEYEYGKTTIGSGCYIGPNTIVAKGVTIGDEVIIGANSLVLEDIPAGGKAWGNPAKVDKKSI